MKLSDWADKQGVAYNTAWRWFRDDKLPVPSTQLETGTILVHPEQNNPTRTILYTGNEQSSLDRLRDFAASNGWPVDGEAASREELHGVLSDPDVKRIIVESPPFDVSLISSALGAHGSEIIVVDT